MCSDAAVNKLGMLLGILTEQHVQRNVLRRHTWKRLFMEHLQFQRSSAIALNQAV
jgi:hypothetical protein